MVFTTNLFELPASFTESRMNSLYADFRKIEDSNPEGFAANISAWKTALISVLGSCEEFPDCTLIDAKPDLVSFFDTALHGTPLALDTVFDELVKQKSLIPQSVFFNPNRYPLNYNPTWWTWMKPRPTALAAWAFEKAGLYDSTWKSAPRNGKDVGNLKKEKYVAVLAVDVVAKALLNAIEKDIKSTSIMGLVKTASSTTGVSAEEPSNELLVMGTPSGYTRSVFTKNAFYSMYNRVKIPPKTGPYNQSSTTPRDIELSELDLDVLLVYLSKDKHKLSIKNNIIKVQLSAENEKEISPISEKDEAVANMKSTIEEIVKRVNALSTHVDSCDKKARTALSSKSSNRQSIAKYAIKSRRLAQEAQDSALKLLSNLEKTLLSIDTATNNMQVMGALETGVDILRSLNKEIGGAEKITELVDELGDEMADTEDIEKRLGSLAVSKVSEEDLDEELEAMLKQEQKKESVTKPSSNVAFPELPTVPTNKPKPEESDTDELASQLEKTMLSN